MKGTWVRSLLLAALLAALACSAPAQTLPQLEGSMQGVVQGTATYRERLALPPEAVFEATLQDVSKAAAEVIGLTRLEGPGNPPSRLLGQMAGTMMACLEGMETEQGFLEALQHVSRWKIAGQQLDLFDAAGDAVARFEARHMP